MTNMPGFNAEIVLKIPRGSYHAAMRNVDTEGITPSGFRSFFRKALPVAGVACQFLPEPARSMCEAGAGGDLF